MKGGDGLQGSDGGGGGGGGDGVTSVNGDAGPAVVLDAVDVGADPAGTATSAVADHVAEPDPHPQYAPLESPEFTGGPLTPTPFPTTDASQKIPNTEWVGNRIGLALGAYQPDLSQAAGTLPVANGGTGITSAGAAGRVLRSNGSGFASAALAVADVTGAAPLASPTFTGDPKAPTPLATDNDTTIATTAFVQAVIAALQATGVLDAREDTASFIPGNTPTYLVFKDFTIAAGTSRTLSGYLILTGGTPAAPASSVISFEDNGSLLARRTSGGVTAVTGSPSVVGTIAGLAAQWVVSGVNARLQIRNTGGAAVRAVLIYRWTESTPP